MSFQALYRKYRPQRFGELVGQEHITSALRNAVREDRVGHAYLFSGPRGNGKTTTARILAKALNCLDLGADGEPCGKCENCVSIAAGTFSDLIEMDAASNRGVDDARDLVSRINLGLGATAKRKVYLLDEVHMLTSAASNTLLKSIEEPPPHVVFVLATTEPDKVLPTIRSRTQHFEFTYLTIDEISRLLASVLDDEGVTYEPEALAIVARAPPAARRATPSRCWISCSRREAPSPSQPSRPRSAEPRSTCACRSSTRSRRRTSPECSPAPRRCSTPLTIRARSRKGC